MYEEISNVRANELPDLVDLGWAVKSAREVDSKSNTLVAEGNFKLISHRTPFKQELYRIQNIKLDTYAFLASKCL